MVQPSKFKRLEFEWDEHNMGELARHDVVYTEAEQCFYNEHRVFRNKKKFGRNYDTFKLEGMTDAGKALLLIFFVKEKTRVRSSFGATALIRVITGWGI
jgi:uncharacterized DUF497 family protein